MTNNSTLSRRKFLIGSVALTGGVAFGAYFLTREPGNPLLDTLNAGEAAITPFIKITPSNITLIVPRADVGQGIMSLQAYLIAEELDVDPHAVLLDPGQPHPAYVNTTIASNGLPFHPLDESFIPRTVRELMAKVAKISGAQFTGGSSSVSDLHETLRHAGAVARETLKSAVHRRTGIPIENLKTHDGNVILPDGEKVAYTDLAADAAEIEPVKEVTLKQPSEWRWLGKEITRTDIVPKSTGTQQYGIDVLLPNMLYATVRANPGRGGGVAKYDASEASSMRGVKKIFPVSDGIAVVADNSWRAFQAAKQLDISWSAPAYPASSEEMWKQLENSQIEKNINSRLRDDGDVEKVFEKNNVVTAEYKTPFLAHAALEPLSATVLFEKGKVVVWTATQVPHAIRDDAAKIAGIKPKDVVVNVMPAGGSFGRRLDHDYVIHAIEIAKVFPGTPIKMTLTREEDMAREFPRPYHLARAKGSVENGKVVAFDVDSISPSLSKSWFSRVFIVPPGPDPLIVWGVYDQPYTIPNYRVTGYEAPENIPVGSWRSPGACSNGFFHESFLSELIYEAKADPLKERLRLIDDPASKKVLETAGEISKWAGPNIGENRGRGIAFTHSHHVPVAMVVDVSFINNVIRIDDVWIVADCGTVFDPINAEAQLTGAAIWGLGHAMNCELTYENYAPVQTNFHAFQGMRLHQTPRFHTRILSNQTTVRGLGEPSTAPSAPALADAIFVATGKRLREMPFHKEVQFL